MSSPACAEGYDTPAQQREDSTTFMVAKVSWVIVTGLGWSGPGGAVSSAWLPLRINAMTQWCQWSCTGPDPECAPTQRPLTWRQLAWTRALGTVTWRDTAGLQVAESKLPVADSGWVSGGAGSTQVPRFQNMMIRLVIAIQTMIIRLVIADYWHRLY